MTSKSHFSKVSIKTLNGAFEQPKMNHRRDFLHENKLSLRDLQKTTNQKLIQQKQELESRQYKHLQKFHKTQEQSFAARSVSQNRNNDPNVTIRQSRVSTRAVNGGAVAPEKPNYLANRRSYSQQRKKVENMHSCCCCQQQPKPQATDRQYRENIPRSASSVSMLSKAESCDKEVQTEDIHDEDFLYDALKKCSSSDIHHLQKRKSVDQLTTSIIPLNDTESSCKYTREHCQDQYVDNKSSDRMRVHQHSSRDEFPNSCQEELEQHFQNFKINNHTKNNHESQLSARSRETVCSTSSKRSVHKLGSREDIHLPRYLEKEKREREEERLRELNKDLNCPEDHYALSEAERLKGLDDAQQKMAALINELNHMPMTVETLRIRNRKVEIEKELKQIEYDIRLYSKPKVYIHI